MLRKQSWCDSRKQLRGLVVQLELKLDMSTHPLGFLFLFKMSSLNLTPSKVIRVLASAEESAVVESCGGRSIM